jgi:hypothetical protein
MVAHEQHHTVAWLQAGLTQPLRASGCACRPLTMGGMHLGAKVNGRAVSILAGDALQQMGQVHGQFSGLRGVRCVSRGGLHDTGNRPRPQYGMNTVYWPS